MNVFLEAASEWMSRVVNSRPTAAQALDAAVKRQAALRVPTTGSGVKAGPRCPHCGTWLSTRYSASQPHQCPPVALVVGSEEARRLAESWAAAQRDPTARLEPVHGTMCRLRWRHCLRCTCDWAPAAGQPTEMAAHALKPGARYAATPVAQSAPAGPVRAWRALCWAWLAGALSGGLVALLVWALAGSA